MMIGASMSPDAFLPLALGLVLLCLKALMLGMATAAMRGRHKRFINPEDAAWLSGEAVGLGDDPGARIGRAHRNDLENLLIFFILASIYLVRGGPPVAAWMYTGTFLLARFVHTLAYLTATPALRRNSYAVAFFTLLALAVHDVVLIFPPF